MNKRKTGEGSWGNTIVNGSTYLTFRKTYNGKRKTFYGKTKNEIKKKVDEFESKNHLSSSDTIQKLLFSTYCTKWLNEWRKQNIKERTFDYYDTTINNYIVDTNLGDTQIKILNNGTIQSIAKMFENHLYQYKDTLSQSTIDGIYTVLNQVCNYGVSKGDFAFNWMNHVEKLSAAEITKCKKETTILSYDQILKLWDEMLRINTADDHVNGSIGSYVYGINAYALLFVAFTGLRWGEVSHITVDEIDYKNSRIRIEKQFVSVKNKNYKTGEKRYIFKEDTPKSKGSIRYVPLCQQAIDITRMVTKRFGKKKGNNELLFSSTNNPVPSSNANKTLKNMCKRAGLPLVSPHELRHSFASVLLYQDEQNLYTVSNLLGHSSADFTYKTYIHIFEEKKVDTVKVFDTLKKQKGTK